MERPPSRNQGIGEQARAIVYIVFLYGFMLVWGTIWLIPVIFSHRMTVWAMKSYVRVVFFVLRLLCGTRCELRGPVPEHTCIVASKHQSFLDVMMLMLWLPEPRFVMKRSIMWVPLLGIFAVRLGCVPIDRGKSGEAMRSIIDGVRTMKYPGQVIIFPQGTRVPPGEVRPYKGGVAKLANETGQDVELAATNAGWFWPRTGVRRSPGVAVMEFLGALPASTKPEQTLNVIESRIECASGRLAEEAADWFRSR